MTKDDFLQTPFALRQHEHCAAEEAYDEDGFPTMYALGGFAPMTKKAAENWWVDNKPFKRISKVFGQTRSAEYRARAENEHRLMMVMKMREFLTRLSKGNAHVERARAATGITRAELAEWRVAVPAFDRAWHQIFEAITDEIEEAAYVRAVHGVAEDVYDKDGQVIGQRRKYSDTLLQMMLQGRRPEVYGPKRQDTAPAIDPKNAVEAMRVLAQGLPD